MNLLSPINKETAPAQALSILAAVEKALGIVPNMIATMAHSPAVANAYLGFSHALSQGALPAPLREQIALAVAEENGCDYCLAAHTFLGAKASLSSEEIFAARRGNAADPKIAAALAFAGKLNRERGHIGEADLAALRGHGFTDGEIAEIIGHVALNIFTNYFNIAAGTTVDFPPAPSLAA